MEPTSRRQFLKRSSAVAAAAGVAAAVPASAAKALTSNAGSERASRSSPTTASVDVPVVAHVHRRPQGSRRRSTPASARSRSRTVVSRPRSTTPRTEPRGGSDMSSHREAPEISKDPVADSTDLYAFVSPDAPNTVTLIANYVPLQGPAGGPNFYEFGDDVLYEINIDNDGDGDVDITYQFQFTTEIEVGGTFLYNVGPITSLDSPHVEPPAVLFGDPDRLGRRRSRRPAPSRPSHVTARRSRSWRRTFRARRATSGPRSTPNYAALAERGDPDALRRHEGVRRPARRGLLRRPRLDLRPRRAPADPAARTSSRSRAARPR